jgi:hypothetical protein
MVKLKIPTKETYFGSEPLSLLEMFKNMVEKVNWVGKLIGCNIYSKNFSPRTIPFFLLNLTLFGYMALNFYSLYLYRYNLERFFFCLVTLAATMLGPPMIYTFVIHRSEHLDLVARNEKFLSNFNTEASNQIFEKWIVITCHVSALLFVTVLFCSLMIFIYPIIYYLIVGEKVLHFGTELPLVDWTTPLGYFLNFAYVATLVHTYCCAINATLIFTIFYIVVSFGQFELLTHLLENLDELILKNKKGEHNAEIKEQIRLIAQMHVELLE